MTQNIRSSSITPETLQLLAAQSQIQLRPEELAPLCRIYDRLEQMKALIRKPRDCTQSTLAHTFKVCAHSIEESSS